MNGPVFVAAVIERAGWSSEISFVGHENTIQVAVRSDSVRELVSDCNVRACLSGIQPVIAVLRAEG